MNISRPRSSTCRTRALRTSRADLRSQDGYGTITCTCQVKWAARNKRGTTQIIKSRHACAGHENTPWNEFLLLCCQDCQYIGSMLNYLCVKVLGSCAAESLVESLNGPPTGNSKFEQIHHSPAKHDIGQQVAVMHTPVCVWTGMVHEEQVTDLCRPLRSDTLYALYVGSLRLTNGGKPSCRSTASKSRLQPEHL